MNALANSIDTDIGPIERVATSDLRSPQNMLRAYTTAHIRRFARFVEEFGVRLPLLIDKHNVICAGLIWYLAAVRLGLPELPVVRVVRLSDDQLAVYRIAEQKLQELAPWDDVALGREFKRLLDVSPHIDLEITGFSTPEIDLRIAAIEEKKPEDTSVLSLQPAKPVCQPGDTWNLHQHRIFCGSALDRASWDALLGNQLADAVLTDPPYNVRIDGHVSGKGAVTHREFAMASGELTDGQFCEFLSSMLLRMKEHSRQGSLHYVFMDWRHLFALLSAARSHFEKLVNICAWVKPNGGMGSFYRSRHELVAVYQNGTGKHRNNVELGRHGRNRTNVWEYAGATTSNGRKTDEGNLLALHPTVKPVELLVDALLDCSAPKDAIVDPFLGSGSTLIASERTHRRCFGIELDPLYVDVAIRRWQRHTGLHAIHEPSNRTFDEVEQHGRTL